MGLHGVAQFVNALNRSIAGTVKPDGVFRAADIIVDGARNADAGHTQTRQGQRAAIGPIAAAAYQPINAKIPAVVSSALLTLSGHHFRTAGCIQNGSAPLEQSIHTAGGQLAEIVVDQSAVAPVDTQHFNPIGTSHAHYSPHHGVHTRRIASRGQHRDPVNILFSHCKNSSLNALMKTFVLLYAFSVPQTSASINRKSTVLLFGALRFILQWAHNAERQDLLPPYGHQGSNCQRSGSTRYSSSIK